MKNRSRKLLRTGSCSHGFTLFEVLIVMAIVGILMGIGAVYLVGFSRGLQLASEASRVVTFLHITRDTAVDTGCPAVLKFTKRDSTTVMVHSGRDVTDCYMMEDTSGSFGRIFSTSGEFVKGLSGKCLFLEDGENADFGENPRWGFDQGFHVEMFVNVTSLGAEVEFLKKDNQFTLSLVPSGSALVYLKGSVVLEDATEEAVSNSAVTFETSRWVRIGFSCVGGVMSLYLDGNSVADAALSKGFSDDTSGNMRMLSGSAGCEAYIDELVVSRWGTIGEKSLASRICLSGLEIRLADADPNNDFLDVTFNPDGMYGEGATLTQLLYYEGKAGKFVPIVIGHTGNIYKGEL
ncbi:prepilin-type N-terminal cleavage/methylation domain-containing protein [Planctomycetota bacterium]